MPALTRDLEQLCSQCGLCCDGTLFTHVSISPSEAKRLEGKVAFFIKKTGDHALGQPCGALEGTCCRVYEERPLACRDYVCNLWEAFDEGEAGLDEALGLVDKAHRLIRAIRVAAPSLPEKGTFNAARRRLSSEDAPPMSRAARKAVADAELHLRFYFGWRD